jgi:hypothetical protein
MNTVERMKNVLVAYTKAHGIMASHVILEEYAETLVRNGATMPPLPEGKWEAWHTKKDGRDVCYLVCSECGSETEIFVDKRNDENDWQRNYGFCPWCGVGLEPEFPFADEV